MERHDERDNILIFDRPKEPGLDFSTRREHMLVKGDLKILDQVRRGAQFLENVDALTPELRAEADTLSKLSPRDRAARLDQRTVELAASFVVLQSIHRGLIGTEVGTPPRERVLGLQIIENRIALLEQREATLIVPFRGLTTTAKFDPLFQAVLINEKTALSVFNSSRLIKLLFHERTHKIQWDAMKDPKAFPHLDERLIGSWSDNARPGHYQRPDVLASEYFAYRNQPLERYAFERSEYLTRKMHEHIAKQFGARVS